MFEALVIEKHPGVEQSVEIRTLTDGALPAGDVTVRVEWSTLNYKDALAITGRGPVIRTFPMVPGIDFAGTVETSTHPNYSAGDRVILNGWGVGERHWGGLAQKACISGDWLVPTPATFTTRQAMSLGTAGYTAMLCVLALQRQGVTPDTGPVLISGASGGVGSIAVMLLGRLGYHVVAMTGRPEETDYLSTLGAAEIVARDTFSTQSKPLETARWAGAIDVAGGSVLASICASMLPGGVVAACGLAAGMDFPATVAPFILRGVTLVGIDSVMCSRERRLEAWERLAALVDTRALDALTTEIGLSEVVTAADALLTGQLHGRVVVRLG